MSPVLLARLKGAKPVEPRTVPRKKTGFCVAAFLLALSFPAHATDYINNDLSSPVVDVNNYVNVTVTNNRTLSSGSLVGGYLYMPGNITGTVDITNNGSITSTHSNYGVFYLPYAGNNATPSTVSIANYGTLATTGTYAMPIYILNNGNFNFRLNNSGTITSADIALFIINGANGSFDITNSGVIDNSASTNPTILLSGNNAVVTNSGSILTNPNAAAAIEVTGDNFTFNVLNGSNVTGKIAAFGSNNLLNIETNLSVSGLDSLTGQLIGTWSEAISGGGTLTIGGGQTVVSMGLGGSGAIANSGTLGALSVSGTNNTLTLAAGSSTGNIADSGALTITTPLDITYSGTISGAGSITKTGNGRLELTGTDTYSGATLVSAGELKINGSLASSVVTVGSGSTLSGNATIGGLTVQSGGTLSPGNSPGTVSVLGPVTFNSGSTYLVQLAGTQSDLLTATGAITIQPGVTLQIQPLAAVTGSSFTFLHSDTSLTGTFSTAVTNGLSVAVGYTANDGTLSILTATPTAVNTQALSALDTSMLFASTVLEGVESGAFERKDNLWVRGLYHADNRQAHDAYVGFNNNIYGTALGAEHLWDDNWKIGFSLADLEGTANIDGSLGKSDGNGVFAAAYGSYVEPVSDAWDVFTSLGLTTGYSGVNMQRLISNSGVSGLATASSNMYQAGAIAAFGARTSLGEDGWYLAPQAKLAYTHIFEQGYTEASGGAAAVSINSYDFGTLRPELKLSIYDGTGFVFPGLDITARPNFNVGIFHEYATDNRSLSGSFSTGTPFTLSIDKHAATFATTGVGIDFDLDTNVTAFAHYQGSFSHQESSHDAKAGVKIGF